jgi:hypothetical protein
MIIKKEIVILAIMAMMKNLTIKNIVNAIAINADAMSNLVKNAIVIVIAMIATVQNRITPAASK